MPDHFKIAVIGTGPGGYIAALKAGQMGASTAVIEKHHLGGTCLNYGCIPSKALLASAEMLHKFKACTSLGLKINGSVEYDWTAIQKRKDKVLATLRGGIKGLFASRKVKLFQGTAKLNGAGRITVTNEKGESREITADKIIIASGSVPSRIPGWPDDVNYICTSDESLHWSALPKRVMIVGGGVIGCEFACMLREYGVEVTIVEMMDSLLPEMEDGLGDALAGEFAKRGIDIKCSVKVEDIAVNGDIVKATISDGTEIEADKVLVATGRRANTTQLGLETVGIETDRGFIRVNDKMETGVDGIYCIGDANGISLLAHAASAQAITAVKNALGKDESFDLPIPGAVYTFPEIGTVGLTSKQVKEKQIPVTIGQFPIGHLGKAMAVGETMGFVRVIRNRDDDTLLGVHMIGHNATEIIESATAMITVKAKAKEFANMVFAHPTLGEAVKEAAEDAFESALHLPPKKVTKLVAESKEV